MPKGIYPRKPNQRLINRAAQTDKFWTEARTRKLRADWATGYTAPWIAASLGCTKNAVIGRAHRLGLETRVVGNKLGVSVPRKEKHNMRGNKVANLSAKMLARKVAEPEPITEPDGAKGCDIFALTPLRCPWPIGDGLGRSLVYCGNGKEPTHNYCPYHSRLSARV